MMSLLKASFFIIAAQADDTCTCTITNPGGIVTGSIPSECADSECNFGTNASWKWEYCKACFVNTSGSCGGPDAGFGYDDCGENWNFKEGVLGIAEEPGSNGAELVTIQGSCGTQGVATDECKGCFPGESEVQGGGIQCQGTPTDQGGQTCAELGCSTVTISTSIQYAPLNVVYKVDKGTATKCKCDMPMCKPDDDCENQTYAVGIEGGKCLVDTFKLCPIDNSACTDNVVEGQPQCVLVTDNSDDTGDAPIVAGITLPLLLLYIL